ncbi:hypothetical protein LJC33_09220, partial [Eubacteriales bacterium OttesenSCG-928-N13]|nr:hypothetical protein [Eubacteriales bacterium OttesenSCG-928-N13]
MADNRYVDYEYDTATDKLGRITQRKDGNGTAPERVTSYTYVAGDPSVAGSTTSLIESITQPGLNLSYTYDDVGNILTEVKNDKTTS